MGGCTARCIIAAGDAPLVRTRRARDTRTHTVRGRYIHHTMCIYDVCICICMPLGIVLDTRHLPLRGAKKKQKNKKTRRGTEKWSKNDQAQCLLIEARYSGPINSLLASERSYKRPSQALSYYMKEGEKEERKKKGGREGRAKQGKGGKRTRRGDDGLLFRRVGHSFCLSPGVLLAFLAAFLLDSEYTGTLWCLHRT